MKKERGGGKGREKEGKVEGRRVRGGRREEGKGRKEGKEEG